MNNFYLEQKQSRNLSGLDFRDHQLQARPLDSELCKVIYNDQKIKTYCPFLDRRL